MSILFEHDVRIRKPAQAMSELGLSAHLDEAILVLTIERPERGNALDGPTTAALIRELEAVRTEPLGVRAVVLAAAGKHFCTGADLSGPAASSGEPERPTIGHMIRNLAAGPHRLIELVWECPVPTVALVHGRSSGLGLHLALACDLAIAAEGATFSEPFSQRGFNVDSGGSWLLQRRIGVARAKQMLYLADPIDAATALDWGLVTEVLPADALDTRGRELARRLAQGPTFAIGETKRLVQEHLTTGLRHALDAEARAIELTIRSDDFKEGMRAFTQKRPPDFTGR